MRTRSKHFGGVLLAGLVAVLGPFFAPPPARADGLIAAFDEYVPGRGFEIGLVNASTGQRLPLPAAVNTSGEELHPALSPDGRFLFFLRMPSFQPQLNGDIVVPTNVSRSILRLDRQTGAVSTTGFSSPGEGGPSVAVNGPNTWFAIPLAGPTAFGFHNKLEANGTTVTGGGEERFIGVSFPTDPGVQHVPHLAVVAGVDRNPNTGALGSRRYASFVVTDPATGAVRTSVASLSGFRAESNGITETSSRTFGSATAPAGHPVPRTGDGFIAFDMATGGNADIKTIASISSPASALAPAPSPITTAQTERMPAWSPNGISLGFIRTTPAIGNTRTTAIGRRQLGVFDATPGIQTLVNPPVDIGADAPTPQTRELQSVWGGLSLAATSALDAPAPAITCNAACRAALTRSTSTLLTPTVSLSTRTQSIGIFVVRVTGTRKLLGRRVARVKPVGRVPLGSTRKGRNRFRWNGKVAGKRLRAGTYLITYRALKSKRVISLSGSIRVRITKRGKVISAKPER